MGFVLDRRLTRDTLAIAILPLCAVRLMNNRLFPWLVLVPRREAMRELIDLPATDRIQCMEELALVSHALQAICRPDKLNIAALGNQVPQLHIHVIARFRHDPAWPNPVWGRGSEVYKRNQAKKFIQAIRSEL